MTEYELSDLILNNTVLMYMDGAAFMTLLSAYIVIVHLVGRTLTRFQISFINFTFIGLATSSTLGWFAHGNRGSDLINQLIEISQNSPVASEASAGIVIYGIFRALVIIGALIYMWQIRRSGKP